MPGGSSFFFMTIRTIHTQHKNLRPRKNKKQNQLVDKVFVTIVHNEKENLHEILFDQVDLTTEEMYSRGFLGDIELPGPEGTPIEATVEAGPHGQFKGDKVGTLVFKVYETATRKPIKAKVTDFNFTKRI